MQNKATPSPGCLTFVGDEYEGSWSDVLHAVWFETARAKECQRRVEALPDPQLDQRMRLLLEEAQAFKSVRDKLLRALDRDLPFFDERSKHIFELAVPSNGKLRTHAQQVLDDVRQRWSDRCTHMLTDLDENLVNRYLMAWRLAPHSPELAAARQTLAAMEAAHGSPWLAREAAAAGATAYRPGAFGPAPEAAVTRCRVAKNPWAPLGPVNGEGHAEETLGIRLPKAAAAGGAMGEGLRVSISTTGLFVGAESKKIAELDGSAARTGFGENAKHTINDLLVVPLEAELARRLEPHDAEVLLFADENVPFRALLEVAFTLTHGKFDRLFLVTDSSAPSLNGFASVTSETSPWITIFVVNDGYAIHAKDQVIAPGCVGVGAGVAVPRIGKQLDAHGLGTCLRKLWAHSPLFGPDLPRGGAYITANPETPYSDIVATIHAAVPAGFSQFAFRFPR